MQLARLTRMMLLVPTALAALVLGVALFTPGTASGFGIGELLGRCGFAAGGIVFLVLGVIAWKNGRTGLLAEPTGLQWCPAKDALRLRLVSIPWRDIARTRAVNVEGPQE